jgi:hypothetical protein
LSRFLLDAMLGKLARYLRMCGHDAAYALDRGVEADDDLLALAREEGRTLLTRDESLAARADDVVLLTEREVTDQLRELRAAGVDVSLPDRPTRCGVCNGALDRVPESETLPDYAPDPAETTVWRCRRCGQYFWEGSHWDDVRRRLDAL